MSRKSIAEAAEEVLRASKRPMTAQEIFDQIVAHQLYDFKAKDPFSVLKGQLYKHSVENQNSCASPNKRFRSLENGTFVALD